MYMEIGNHTADKVDLTTSVKQRFLLYTGEGQANTRNKGYISIVTWTGDGNTSSYSWAWIHSATRSF